MAIPTRPTPRSPDHPPQNANHRMQNAGRFSDPRFVFSGNGFLISLRGSPGLPG